MLLDWRHNAVWFDQLPESTKSVVDLGKLKSSDKRLLSGDYVLATNFKSKSGDFADFPATGSAIYLELHGSNIRSFEHISRFGQIKRLELHYCLKLETDEGLSAIRESLEWLHISQSKRLSPKDPIHGLSHLKVLCLNSCAPLESLNFLSNYPELIDFRFVDTAVLDGDLTPLLSHPTLCSVGFLDKHTYNVRNADVKAALKEKRDAAINRVRNGSLETFRYNELG